MSRQKTPKLDRFRTLPNCYDHANDQFNETAWKVLLKNRQLILELGCGKAEVSRWLAIHDREHLIIGVDVKADRLQRAGTLALEDKLTDFVLLRAHVTNLPALILAHSVAAIWLTFPDPYPKAKHAKRRMIGPEFIALYKTLLIPGGKLYFKTDDDNLFLYGLDTLETDKDFEIDVVEQDLHTSSQNQAAKTITTFERRFMEQGLSIKYLEATLESN